MESRLNWLLHLQRSNSANTQIKTSVLDMNKSKGSTSPPQDYRSPLLTKALQKYRSELRGGDNIVLEAESLEQLLTHAKSFETPFLRNSNQSSPLNRLESIFSYFNDFAAVMAVCFGADAKVAGVVWGSIRIILTVLPFAAFKLAAPSKDILNDIIDMLEDISSSLPRFTTYEKTLPINSAFESALMEAYTEMTCFCARTINFFRENPHHPLIRKAWPRFSDDFQKTMKRLKHRTQTVEAEAEVARMRVERERHEEVLSLMKAFQEHNKIKEDVLPCYFIPLGINERVLGREEELRKLREALDPQKDNPQSRSLALYGMGGVGKSTIALQYANNARNLYDAIFWISADNIIKMMQDFLDIAQKLDLVPKDRKSEDANAAMAKVKAWLNETKCRWLVVFDNADDLEILTQAWPGIAAGAILLTSRDFTAGFSPASVGLAVQPFDVATGSAAFLELLGQTDPSQTNIELAREITNKLGGLPLALRQISGFVVKQRLSLKDFLPLYNRNAGKINAKKSGLSDYQHTLSTVWRLALGQLTGNASSLQKLLTFFDPDRVDEKILRNDKVAKARSDEFDFLQDEMDFLDAEEVLLRAALIGRSEESSCLSIHRLVQGAVLESLTTQERETYIDQAIKLLAAVFPCPWKSGPGYTFTSWDKCQMCLPHVHFLVAQAEKHKIRGYDHDIFAELLLRCCWYLYESERCHEGLPLARIALEALQDHNSLVYAQGVDIQGLLWLDTFRPKKALECFDVCWKIRGNLLEANDPFIAVALNHISLAYTELRDFIQAAAYQQKAINIRLEIKSTMIGNSYSNMSSILLGMDKPEEAEAMLMNCPSLKDMTDENFLRTDNPRFSSDMVLLGRIRVCQKRFEDALRLRSKALVFRQKTYGDRYKTCDSLYQIANLLYSRGDPASAANLIRKSLVFLENLPEPEGFMARAYFKLAEIHASLGSDPETQKKCEDLALEYSKKAYTDLSFGEEYEEANFNLLVPWMMW